MTNFLKETIETLNEKLAKPYEIISNDFQRRNYENF